MLSHLLATSETVSVLKKKLQENEDKINFSWM